MAYVNYNKKDIIVLSGFEAAMLVAARTRNEGEPWKESEFEDVMEHGIQHGMITPLADDVLGDWFLEPAEKKLITLDGYQLYYVSLDALEKEELSMLFSGRLLHLRTFTLYSTNEA